MRIVIIALLLTLCGQLSAQKPNIVFIEVDDLTYKYLGCMGNPIAQTPAIDSLAKEGVLFKNAVCQGMMCGPSRNSLITGLYPHNLGMYVNGQMNALPQGVWTLPKAMQQSGYFTSWIGKCHVRPYIKGARTEQKQTAAMQDEMGFDFVEQTVGRAVLRKRTGNDDIYKKHLMKKGLLNKFLDEYPKPSTLPEEDYLDGFFTVLAEKWIRGYKEEKPFLLWLNYSLPHGPHDVEKKYLELFSPKQMPKPIERSATNIERSLLAHNKPVKSVEDTLKRRAVYQGCISFLDRQVGKVLKALDNKGIRQNTIIVFFSDHGIMMGDHGLLHKGTLWKEVTNPSLIISYPAKFIQNSQCKRPVELLDILQTVLDISGSSKKAPNGESLMPLLTGKGIYKRKVAFGEIEGHVAAVTDRYKYISGIKPLLYDLHNDPDEMKNVIQQAPEKASELQSYVDEFLKNTGPFYKAGELKK
jgi:arylsulfatase A-like enzyme